MRQWRTRNDYVPLLHDPLALYCCLYPERIGTGEITATVLDEGETCGLTLNLDDYDGFYDKSRARKNVILTEVDVDDAAREFMRLVYGAAVLTEKRNEVYAAIKEN